MSEIKMGKKKIKPVSQPWYSVNALASGKTEIFIYGNIGEDWWNPEESNTAKSVIGELEGIGDVTVRVNSVGGSLVDGIAIYNALRRHSGAVDVEIDAVAYSAASLIAMAGDTVSMASNALLMVHAPWNMAAGNAAEFRRQADVLDKYADAMVQSYVRDGGMDSDEVETLLKDGEDHYYTAAEAQELGLIDHITDSVDIAASLRDMPLQNYRKPITAAMAAAKPTPGAKKMPKETPAAKPEPVKKEDINVVAIQQAAETKAMAAIAARNEEIGPIFAMHADKPGVTELQNNVLMDPAITVDQARAQLLDKLGEKSEPINKPGSAVPGEDSRDKRVLAMTGAVLARVGDGQIDRSNPYRGMKLMDMARASLENAGVNIKGLYPEELAPMALSSVQAAQTNSDFPVILENTLHKLVLNGFKAHVATWQRIAKIGDVTDFRAWNRLVPGLIGNLDGVDEHGAYLDKPMPDAEKNSITAVRHGNIISVTPETLVNDDLGEIQTMANGLGMAGSRAIERAFYLVIVANPTLSDGVALFAAGHGNLAGTGAVPSVTTIDAARVAMSIQTAPGADAEYLDIRPKMGLCNVGLEGAFKSVLGAEYDDEATKNQRKPNTVRNLVEVVSTPRVGAAPWYLFAEPNEAPVIEVVFLNGQREPRVVMEENFRTSGMSWKVELPFGVGAIDYRGAYQNPGA